MILPSKSNKTVVVGILLFVFFLSCTKNDYSQISTRIIWNPNFSVPLGKSSFDMADLEPSINFDLFDLEDTFFVADTIPFDFSELFINTEYINYVMFRTYIENGFPAKLKAQTYFIDGGNKIIDSLYASGPILVSPADIDNDGNLIKIAIETKDEHRTEDGVDILEGIRYMWVNVWVYDFDLLGVETEDYYLDLEMGFQTEVEKENKK